MLYAEQQETADLVKIIAQKDRLNDTWIGGFTLSGLKNFPKMILTYIVLSFFLSFFFFSHFFFSFLYFFFFYFSFFAGKKLIRNLDQGQPIGLDFRIVF